jgi:1-deoxy-D-xylulose-5-phosphate synthase
MSVLDSIRSARDVADLPVEQIPALCGELRRFIQQVTLDNGGHLASSLGAVELVVALLRVFDPTRDRIIFDVGHQAYAYKILTGRRERFHTLRTRGGITGFPKRGESPCDAFDVGHSSTSISAALGFAKARDLLRQRHDVVAVIGDGALLNGVALEALNNIRAARTKVIVVLNDNGMSISPRVGGLAEHLARLRANPTYLKLKQFIKGQCRSISGGEALDGALSRIKTKVKSLILPPNMFEELDLHYWGPFDGHDAEEMTEILHLARRHPESILVHVITKKGKGCPEAEANPSEFHGVSPGTSLRGTAAPKPRDWSRAVADLLEKLAEEDPRVVGCIAAMKEGARLADFARKYPTRFFDVGIAEEHLVTYAGGLAAGGMRPVVFLYSTFLQRAMDQLVHDVCLPDLPVLLAVDRAGLVGEDGETHQGLLDIAWGRSIPNLSLLAPRDAVDLEFMMRGWLYRRGPALIRYPRGAVPHSIGRSPERDGGMVPWGEPEILRRGERIGIVAVGSTVRLALEAADLAEKRGEPPLSVVDARFLKPLDERIYDDLFASHEALAVLEEGYEAGGFGENLARRCQERGFFCRVIPMAVPDRFIPQATRAEQWGQCGLTPERILERIRERALAVRPSTSR